MSEMVERVRLALKEELGFGVTSRTARAAIAAMREPTKAMIEAADSLAMVDAGQAGVDQAEIWRAMIDAALRDEAQEGE